MAHKLRDILVVHDRRFKVCPLEQNPFMIVLHNTHTHSFNNESDRAWGFGAFAFLILCSCGLSFAFGAGTAGSVLEEGRGGGGGPVGAPWPVTFPFSKDSMREAAKRGSHPMSADISSLVLVWELEGSKLRICVLKP